MFHKEKIVRKRKTTLIKIKYNKFYEEKAKIQ